MRFLFVIHVHIHICDTGSGAGGEISGNQYRDGKISREGGGAVVSAGEGHVALEVFEGENVASEGHDGAAEVVFGDLLDVGKVKVHR